MTRDGPPSSKKAEWFQEVSVLSEAFGLASNEETPVEAGPLRNVVAHSKVHPAAVRRQAPHVSWTPEEEATVLRMKEAEGRS
jgi:hypothetical protein